MRVIEQAPDLWVSQLVATGDDADRRARIADQMLEGYPRLLNDAATVRAMQDVLSAALSEMSNALPSTLRSLKLSTLSTLTSEVESMQLRSSPQTITYGLRGPLPQSTTWTIRYSSSLRVDQTATLPEEAGLSLCPGTTMTLTTATCGMCTTQLGLSPT